MTTREKKRLKLIMLIAISCAIMIPFGFTATFGMCMSESPLIMKILLGGGMGLVTLLLMNAMGHYLQIHTISKRRLELASQYEAILADLEDFKIELAPVIREHVGSFHYWDKDCFTINRDIALMYNPENALYKIELTRLETYERALRGYQANLDELINKRHKIILLMKTIQSMRIFLECYIPPHLTPHELITKMVACEKEFAHISLSEKKLGDRPEYLHIEYLYHHLYNQHLLFTQFFRELCQSNDWICEPNQFKNKFKAFNKTTLPQNAPFELDNAFARMHEKFTRFEHAPEHEKKLAFSALINAWMETHHVLSNS